MQRKLCSYFLKSYAFNDNDKIKRAQNAKKWKSNGDASQGRFLSLSLIFWFLQLKIRQTDKRKGKYSVV